MEDNIPVWMNVTNWERSNRFDWICRRFRWDLVELNDDVEEFRCIRDRFDSRRI